MSTTPFEKLEDTLRLIESITDGLAKIDDASSLTDQLFKFQVALT